MSKLSDLLNPVSSSGSTSVAPPPAPGSPSTPEAPHQVSSSISTSQNVTGPQPRDRGLNSAVAASAVPSLTSMTDLHPSPGATDRNEALPPHPSAQSASPPATAHLPMKPAPIEPSPPIQHTQQPFSPTLEQYHHGSGSPTQEERQPRPQRDSPPPRLAPMHPSSGTPPPVSEVVSAPERSNLSPSAGGDAADRAHNDSLQHEVKPRGSESIHQGPVTSQIHQPSSAPPPAPRPENVPETSGGSPKPDVKMEASTTPHEIEPPSPEPVSIEGDPRDPADSPPATAEPPGMKIVTEFAKDSMKAQSREASTPTRGTPTPTTAKAGKKARPPPKSATSKKGTASAAKKPPNKKRKLDSESLDGAPSAKRSATPASSRASKTPAAANRMQSSTPAAASSSPPPIDRDAGEGGDIFCTCRRPDDHTWMIGCDGGCEDWFHGKCVKIKEEDGDLIDKYICPNCHAKGKGHTTWKRMCRLDGCRRPARLMKNGLIKYCSEEHGREFVMRRLPKGKKRRRVEEEEDDARSVGGVLSIGQLAAIATSVKSGDDFRTIGEGVLSPPPTAIVDEHGDYVMGDDGDEPKAGARFNEQEQKRTTRIAHARERLQQRTEGLRSRGRFLQLVKDRAKRVLAELPGVKDICGFDSRLSWTEEEFLAWTASEVGQAAFSSGVLGAPPKISPDATDGEGTGVGAGVCQKKRCERHRQWRNIQAQDLKSEEASVAEELDQLMREELEVRERAKLRMLKEADGDREGRVEVVG